MVLRHLLLSGQACRLKALELEAHALFDQTHAPLRAMDVLVPWLLQGCPAPVKVRLERFYGTNASRNAGAHTDVQWPAQGDPWCRSCALLDHFVDPLLQ